MTSISVGRVYEIAAGGTVTITRKITLTKVEVQHNDKYGHKVVVTTANLRDGNIKNPYRPNVHGKGFFGAGPYVGSKGKHNYPSYRIWNSLIKRVYAKNSELSLCSEWHDFQVFTRWYLNELEMIEEGSFTLSDYVEDGHYGPPIIVPEHLQKFYLYHSQVTKDAPDGVSLIREDGVEFGYPTCCVESFVDDVILARIGRRQDRKLSGTGFIPCVTCDVRYSEEALVDIINQKRDKSLEPFAPLEESEQ